jgi:hypothetical protein
LSAWFIGVGVVDFDVLGFNASTVFPFGVGLFTLSLVVWAAQGVSALVSYRITRVVLLIGFLLFNFGNISSASASMERTQDVSKHGKVLAQLLLNRGPSTSSTANYPVNVILDDSSLSFEPYAFALLFWGVPNDRYVMYRLAPIGEQDVVPSWLGPVTENFRSVHSAKDLPGSGLVVTTAKYPNPIATYQVQGIVYYVYRLPVSSEKVAR